MRNYVLAALLVFSTAAFAQQPLAPTPPMGWNSWDAYGTAINEQNFRANAQWIAQHLKPAGYQYLTIDEAWFALDAPPGGSSNASLDLDPYGRYIPAPLRFPSSADGQGFAPLADYLHSLGLKFGIHVLQGIPKKAVAENLPIEGSPFHAKDAANTASGCQWNTDNYDLQDSPAGQAYYDSIVRLYAAWHVDLIKIDCIASRPYKGEEIRMFHEAIEKATAKTGRPIVLSLSPGPAPLNEAANLQAYSQQWRISDDVWDIWQSTGPFPQGVNDQIARAARWLPYAGPGHWPDLDMLPIGNLRPSPGLGQPRKTRLTPTEQQTMLTLWAIVRSPLVYGGDPVSTDPETLALLTNPDVIAVDQHSHGNRVVSIKDDLALYTAIPDSGKGIYCAVFNRSNAPLKLTTVWAQVGLPAGRYRATNLWTHEQTPPAPSFDFDLAPHASILLRVTPN